MSIELKMPALSPTMEEGTLAKWLVKEGDTVSSGDILAEIETDKATMEFEAVDEGTIARILIPEGSDGVKVGTPIAILVRNKDHANWSDVMSPDIVPEEHRRAPRERRLGGKFGDRHALVPAAGLYLLGREDCLASRTLVAPGMAGATVQTLTCVATG